MSNNIDISDIRALDRKLIKLEEDFKEKLDKYWSEYEKDILKKISKYKSGYIKKVSLNRSKQQGLEKLYKDYFRAVDKITQKITRANLEINAKANDKEIVIKLKVDKSKTDYLERAKYLSTKQFNDYQDILNYKLKDKSKITHSVNDFKKIITEETQKFKNVRLNLSAEYESNRIANNIREELGIKSGIVIGIVFNAVVDERTTKHICLPRDRTVLRIDDPRLIYFKPPLHPRCRSYWSYIYKGSNIKFTDYNDIANIISNYSLIRVSDSNKRDDNEELFGTKSLKPKEYPNFNNLSKGIKFFRKEIINSTKNIVERYFILDINGNYVYDEWGTKSGVNIYDSVLNKLKSATLFIHNHPSSASFSEADIITASIFNISEFRAISIKGIHGNVDYIMKNAGNIKLTRIEKELIKNNIISLKELKIKKIKIVFFEETEKVKRILKNKPKNSIMENNLIVERVCKRLGIIYERIKY